MEIILCKVVIPMLYKKRYFLKIDAMNNFSGVSDLIFQ